MSAWQRTEILSTVKPQHPHVVTNKEKWVLRRGNDWRLDQVRRYDTGAAIDRRKCVLVKMYQSCLDIISEMLQERVVVHNIRLLACRSSWLYCTPLCCLFTSFLALLGRH